MTRKMIHFITVALSLALAVIVYQAPIAAGPPAQTGQRASQPTALPQPLRIVVHQQLPITLTMPLTGAPETSAAGETTAPTQTVAVTLSLDLGFNVTRTLTTTVISSVTLRLSDQTSVTVPVSLTFSAPRTALVNVTPLKPIGPAFTTRVISSAPTATATVTATVPSTPTGGATATVAVTATTTTITKPVAATTPTTTTQALASTPTPAVADIRSTVPVTANLRSGPDVSFTLAGQIGAGQRVKVVAQDVSGNWYLLDNGAWIANFLVENAPTDLPVATEALIASLPKPGSATTLTTVAATATATTVAPTATATPQQPATGNLILVPTAIPTPAPVKFVSSTNANLRAGPGTEFAIVGGTIIGQELDIVGRNADSSWYQLRSGGWIATPLIVIPPDPNTVPVIRTNQVTSTTSVTGTTAVTSTTAVTATEPVLRPTPTP
jgi:uncharacterized protein YgiM (DUF1202 family)